MKSKPILRPERLRHVPRPFNWIDQRLVDDRDITRCRSDALALYLLLTDTVLDRLLHHAETVIIEGSSYRMKDRVET
jgi:DNA replication protein DnaC